MKKLIFRTFALLILLLAIGSCNKDEQVIDDTDINEELPKYYVYHSTEEMITSLDSIYAILRRGEKVERVELYPVVTSGDALAGGEPGGNDQTSLQQFMRFSATPTTWYLTNYWKSMFEGISLTNKFILNANASKDSAGISENIRLRTIGEAYFLKSLFYYKLTLIFGGFPQLQNGGGSLSGIPIIENIFNPDSIVYARPSLDTTWFYIRQYLKTSIEFLPERSSYSQEDYGRASKGAAKSLLVKVDVCTENWAEAYQYANEVINSGEYYLEGDNNHMGPYIVTRLTKDGLVSVNMPPYKWIWQPEANNCGESVFYVQHYADHTTLFPEGQMGNLIPQYFGVRNILTYNLSGELNSTTLAWGFILPTTFFVKTAFKDIGCEDLNGNILDPRFKLSVISEGDSVPYYYQQETLRMSYPDSVLYDAWYNWPCTGYTTWKYFTDPIFRKEMTSLGDNPQSTKFLRFAEVLLLGAEAAVHIGQNTDAIEWVNFVRERARNSGSTGYPLPLTSVTLDDIYAERRVELAFEGHQFYDIVRTGRTQKVLLQDAMNFSIINNPDGIRTAPQQFGDFFIIGKSELLPIPQSAIDLSNGMLQQNAGY